MPATPTVAPPVQPTAAARALLIDLADGQPHVLDLDAEPSAAELVDNRWIANSRGRSRIPTDGLYHLTGAGFAALHRSRQAQAAQQCLVSVQTAPDEAPLVAVTSLAALQATVTAMVLTTDGAAQTLDDFCADGTADDRWGAVLHYLGAETCRETLAAYDASSPFTLDTGFETMLTVCPLPAAGQVVNLWDGTLVAPAAEARP